MPSIEKDRWQWENATAGAVAGFATVASLHPLDVVRTRFQVNNGQATNLPSYKNTGHALFTIARSEGLRGLYAGFYPSVLGSTVSWALYFFFYGRAKLRYSKGSDEQLTPAQYLVSATEAGALVCLFTNPIWVIKTRLQLQTPLHKMKPYLGFYDALRTILREEGWHAFYKGMGPSLLLVSHGAIQFTTYEELRKKIVRLKCNERMTNCSAEDKLLNSVDYAVLGASSKFVAILLTYPYQVIRSRVQQRPNNNGIPKYVNSWHVLKETIRSKDQRGRVLLCNGGKKRKKRGGSGGQLFPLCAKVQFPVPYLGPPLGGNPNPYPCWGQTSVDSNIIWLLGKILSFGGCITLNQLFTIFQPRCFPL